MDIGGGTGDVDIGGGTGDVGEGGEGVCGRRRRARVKRFLRASFSCCRRVACGDSSGGGLGIGDGEGSSGGGGGGDSDGGVGVGDGGGSSGGSGGGAFDRRGGGVVLSRGARSLWV